MRAQRPGPADQVAAALVTVRRAYRIMVVISMKGDERMLQVTVRRVRPEKVERLKAWLAEAERRADEVRETFRQEGVRHEQALLVETSDGPLLVYVGEMEDVEAAQRVFAASELPIDAEHKAVLTEVLGERVPTTTLLDLRLDG
jgi:hypothetical protein